MPRHALPSDDLYARLQVPPDASLEAIEVAWRALLKLHHPDVAGDDGLEAAKKINVAHDWLSDADLRARYDRERHAPPGSRSIRGGWHPRGRDAAPRADAAEPQSAPATARRPDPAVELERFVDRAGRLTLDERDRLSVAEAPSIAFVASIRRFLSPDRVEALASVEARVAAALGPDAWATPAIRDAVLAAAHELVLRDFLDEHLAEPFRGRVADRLTRAWEAAIGQPRYGPNTAGVRRFLTRAGELDVDALRTLARASGRGRLAPPVWPRGIDPDEDEVFRVSSALAGRDGAAVAAAALAMLDRATASRARRVLGRTAHAVVLRHAFTADEFAAQMSPWHAATGDPGTGRGAPQRPDPSVRRSA